ncbi:neprilysin-2-like [Musca vetustissima]|uniref:neprilysin-2-like n=1 Tax=Musca vetustissima TaxID=27455 RepID=UPI002AB600C9|nr:neprilysin-2-like [Musca vetustissima]
MKLKQIPILISCVSIFLANGQTAAAIENKHRGVNRQHEKYIESCINLNVDPCENFYEYACGKWQEYQVSEGGEDIYTEMLGLASYKANKELARKLDVMELNDMPDFVKKFKIAYDSCVTLKDFDLLHYVKWLRNNENITLPAMDEFNYEDTQNFDWIESLAVLRRYGLNRILIQENMIVTNNDTKKMILSIGQPEDNFLKLTSKNLKSLLNSMSISLDPMDFQILWQEIQQIEQRIKIMQMDEEEQSDDMYVKLKDLTLPWLRKYLSRLLNQSVLDDNIEVQIVNINYLVSLVDNLTKDFNNFQICKYLAIRFLWLLHQNTPTNFSHWECADMLHSLLPLASNWLYREQHSQLTYIVPEMEQIFQNIVLQFNQSLNEQKSFLNPKSFQYLSKKLWAIKLKIGNLPEIRTTEFVEHFYGNISLSSEDFYGNHLKLLDFAFYATHVIVPNIPQTDSMQYFYIFSLDDNILPSPYYDVDQNIVVVPYTSLRPPIYHRNFEQVYKYSALGSAIGHEIFHCFDNTGLQFDATGLINTAEYNRILETPIIAKNIKCINNLNPASLDEKIADISGLRYTYKAFVKQFPKAHTQTRLIHGKSMKLTEIFFLNFAQYYCDIEGNEDDDNYDEHGLASDRVNDALGNLIEFSNVYNCTPASKMYAMERCQMWRR